MNDAHLVTDIPNTYRVHLFRAMGEALAARGVGFRVTFLARHQRYRVWAEASGPFGFRHAFGSGPTLYPRHDLPVHINPGLLAQILRNPGTWLMLGGSWYQPAVLGAAYLARPRHLLLCSENADRMTFSDSGPVERVRRNVHDRVQGFVVPGQRADAHAQSFARHPSIRLPNTVDESLFRDRVAAMRRDRETLRARWNIGDAPALLWPARLIPVKGVVPFLEAIRDLPGEFTVLLAGDGILAEGVGDCIDRAGLGSRVRTLGRVRQDQMLELYAASDALLLASLFDPYPLSTIEALWAALPLVLSDRVGSVPEVLEEGTNGWVFDPTDAEGIRSTLGTLVATGRADLAAMGEASKRLAEQRFETARVADTFAASLLEVFPV